MIRRFQCALVAGVLLLAAIPAAAAARISPTEWRRFSLETMRVAASPNLIEQDLDAYLRAGLNTLVVYDVNGINAEGTEWLFKSEDQIRRETEFARAKGIPLVLGLAVEPFAASLSRAGEFSQPALARAARFPAGVDSIAPNGLIPAATDSLLRERLALWKKYGDDFVVGVFPWYDDVFLHTVDVERQRHVYRIIKEIVPEWYVFGMIGEFGFGAADEEVERYYDPGAFDHLIVLLYPYNVGQRVTDFPLDNVASSDPDGDLIRYIDRFIARMNERFFRLMQPRQLILFVGQAFYYVGEPQGHIPRNADIALMTRRTNDRLRKLPGQSRNHSWGYFCWGAEGSSLVGLSQRPDWREATRNVGKFIQ